MFGTKVKMAYVGRAFQRGRPVVPRGGSAQCSSLLPAGPQASCYRQAFQRARSFRRIFLMPRWGAAMARMTNRAAKRREALAGSKALRKQFSHKAHTYNLNNFIGAGFRTYNHKAVVASLVRIQAMKVYAVLATMGILPNAELQLAAGDATARFSDTGFSVMKAVALIGIIWNRLPKGSKPVAVAQRICNRLFLHQSYPVVRDALKLFMQSMARYLPVKLLKRAVRVLKYRLKHGATYVYRNNVWRVRVPALQRPIRTAIAKLKKLIAARHGP